MLDVIHTHIHTYMYLYTHTHTDTNTYRICRMFGCSFDGKSNLIRLSSYFLFSFWYYLHSEEEEE